VLPQLCFPPASLPIIGTLCYSSMTNHVRVADSVQSALREISSQKFDVVLSDLNIGEPRDGFSVVKAASETNPLCVAILLTGYPDFESAVEGINCEVERTSPDSYTRLARNGSPRLGFNVGPIRTYYQFPRVPYNAKGGCQCR
jgi:CheY-like chemotaxis protein